MTSRDPCFRFHQPKASFLTVRPQGSRCTILSPFLSTSSSLSDCSGVSASWKAETAVESSLQTFNWPAQQLGRLDERQRHMNRLLVDFPSAERSQLLALTDRRVQIQVCKYSCPFLLLWLAAGLLSKYDIPQRISELFQLVPLHVTGRTRA